MVWQNEVQLAVTGDQRLYSRPVLLTRLPSHHHQRLEARCRDKSDTRQDIQDGSGTVERTLTCM